MAYRVVMDMQSHLWAQSQAEPGHMRVHTHTYTGNSPQDAASVSNAECGITTDRVPNLATGMRHTEVLLNTKVVFLEACRQLHFP